MVLTPLASRHSIETPLTYPPVVTVADWWDPDCEELSIVAAYRAINSAGTPWPGGPTNYAESLVNQANPGTFDLTEGNGAVPWAAATGWSFTKGNAQYFDTGIVPVLVPTPTWTALIRFSNLMLTFTSAIFGVYESGATRTLLLQHLIDTGMQSWHGAVIVNAPLMATGNYGIAAKQPYRNGLPEPNTIPAGGAALTLSIFIGAANINGAASSFITGSIQAWAIYDVTLIDSQVLAVATAMGQL